MKGQRWGCSFWMRNKVKIDMIIWWVLVRLRWTYRYVIIAVRIGIPI
jgi:hypothetical protein